MGKKRFQISGASARDFTHTPVAYAARSDVQIFYEDMLNVYDARMCCAEEDATHYHIHLIVQLYWAHIRKTIELFVMALLLNYIFVNSNIYKAYMAHTELYGGMEHTPRYILIVHTNHTLTSTNIFIFHLYNIDEYAFIFIVQISRQAI